MHSLTQSPEWLLAKYVSAKPQINIFFFFFLHCNFTIAQFKFSLSLLSQGSGKVMKTSWFGLEHLFRKCPLVCFKMLVLSKQKRTPSFVRKIFGFGQTQLEMSPSLFRHSGVMLSKSLVICLAAWSPITPSPIVKVKHVMWTWCGMVRYVA